MLILAYEDHAFDEIDDLMSPDFLIYHTFDAILGHIRFKLRFVDFHRVACSSPLTRIVHLMIDDLVLPNFLSTTLLMPYWGIFPSGICMLVPTYGIHAETMTYLLSYHDILGEPFLSHSVRLTLFGIRMSSRLFFWEMPL